MSVLSGEIKQKLIREFDSVEQLINDLLDQEWDGEFSAVGHEYLTSDHEKLYAMLRKPIITEQDNATLRKIISDCATACGAFISTDASIGFMQQLPAEIKAKTAQRITEQDAREIAASAVAFMFKPMIGATQYDYWMHEEGRALLDKLNEVSDE